MGRKRYCRGVPLSFYGPQTPFQLSTAIPPRTKTSGGPNVTGNSISGLVEKRRTNTDGESRATCNSRLSLLKGVGVKALAMPTRRKRSPTSRDVQRTQIESEESAPTTISTPQTLLLVSTTTTDHTPREDGIWWRDRHHSKMHWQGACT